MAFNLIVSFSSSRPMITAKTVPPSNDHHRRLFNLNTYSLSDTRTKSHVHALLSLPLKHYNNYETSTTSIHDDLSVGTPSNRWKVLKRMLRELGGSWESLSVIDATQRLGLDYLFQEEIEIILQRHHEISTFGVDHERDLHNVALRFRLLRQQGYYVSADVFEIFMDKKGNFDKKLGEDINGLMSLYEASQLCMQGEEDILEEARNFSRQILSEKTKNSLDHHLTRFVDQTLAFPHHKSLSTFMVKNYFGDTQGTNKWISILQQVAQMDFNATQALRQTEIVQFLQWWKESDLAQHSQFARHQPLLRYTCSLVCFKDARFSEERILLAKSISFIYLVDDLFDVYGTLDELTLFTQVVCRWDMTAAEQLPNSMKLCFIALHEITNEISYNVYQKHGYNPINSLRKEWAKLCEAFLIEAEWFTSGHYPSTEEYLKNGIVSTGVPLTLTHVYFLLGQGISEETVQLLDRNPDIVSSSALILRLWDDLGNAEDENQDGYDGAYVEYYMKEHPEISSESTKQHIENLISDAWKILNRECVSLQNPFHRKFVEASLNIARMVPIAYNYGRDQSSLSLENLVKSVLFQSVETEDNVIITE